MYRLPILMQKEVLGAPYTWASNLYSLYREIPREIQET